MSSNDSCLPWLVIIFGITSIILYSLPSQYGRFIGKERSANRIQILVLGDIGRSPRMQYHALSVAKHGGQVDLVGYMGSDIHPDILANSASIKIHALDPTPEYLRTESIYLFILYGPLKVLFQIWNLWMLLGYQTRPARWMLVQNPPSIPTLFIAQTICFLRHTRLVIDWHNFGHSILALKLGNGHPLVHLSRLYEWSFARAACAHFCVTDAMSRVLKCDYGISSDIRPLHDRPASHFNVLNGEQRLRFLEELPTLLHPEGGQNLRDCQASVTMVKKGRAKMLVSSTSWTPDEDFSLLLDALIKYSDLAITTHPELPEIFAVITGNGPQKADFITQISNLKADGKLEMVAIETAFFSINDYAKLLGSADLGVSLHTSSSGVDLPMKVVDMFGAGLPVAGWGDFEAWPEILHEGVNGTSFSDAAGLQVVLMQLFGVDKTSLERLKEGAIDEGRKRWDDEWDTVAAPLFFHTPSH